MIGRVALVRAAGAAWLILPQLLDAGMGVSPSRLRERAGGRCPERRLLLSLRKRYPAGIPLLKAGPPTRVRTRICTAAPGAFSPPGGCRQRLRASGS